MRFWITQLLDPDIASLIASRQGQIEIRLYANHGKVRKHPVVMFDAGQSVMVDPTTSP